MAAHICNSITQQTETIGRILNSRPVWTIWLHLVLKKKIQFNLVKRFSQVGLIHAIRVLAITVDRLPPTGINEVLLWKAESVQGLVLSLEMGVLFLNIAMRLPSKHFSSSPWLNNFHVLCLCLLPKRTSLT